MIATLHAAEAISCRQFPRYIHFLIETEMLGGTLQDNKYSTIALQRQVHGFQHEFDSPTVNVLNSAKLS